MKILTRQYLTASLLASVVLSSTLMFSLEPIYASLIAFNVVGFILMGMDKKAARQQRQRIPENVFLVLSFLCAGPGILFAGMLFRHKIRKRFFFTTIIVITLLYASIAKIIVKQ